MTLLTVLILIMTLIMTLVMAPRVQWASLRADILYADGEARALRLLLAEQNEWVLVHLGCGIAVVTMIWLLRRFAPDVPESACIALGVYAGTCFVYAVLESVLAHRIEKLCCSIPAPARADGQ